MSSFRRSVQLAAVIGLFLSVASILQAARWAVVADAPRSRISMLDFGTTPATVSGPFVTNQLGSEGGGVFDVAIMPDGKNALISNFGDSTVYRVDLSTPTNPIVTGCVTNGFFAEDIAIAPNGQFALVTDGGLSSKMGIIDLASFSTSLVYSLTSGYAVAVAIARDNQTVVLADYADGLLIYGIIGPTGLVSETVLSTGGNLPVNVAISPDGKTVLLANANTNIINVFRILGPGNIVTGETPVVTGLVPGLGSQSIAFSPQGDRAYVLQNGNETNMLSWLQINGPGNVTLGGAGVATLAPKSSGQLYGVDTLAVSPDGKWILASNPTLMGATNLLTVVNASTFAVAPLDPLLELPVGVAFIPVSAPSADFDGDLFADPYMVNAAGNWYIWFSGAGYDLSGGPWPLGAAGMPVAADFDGDGLADPAMAADGGWTIWMSSGGWQPWGPFDFSAPGGVPVAADFDGDHFADPAMVVNGGWTIWMSQGGWQPSGPYAFSVPGGAPMASDFDGDGLADPAMVVNNNWTLWPSLGGWQPMGPFPFVP